MLIGFKGALIIAVGNIDIIKGDHKSRCELVNETNHIGRFT